MGSSNALGIAEFWGLKYGSCPCAQLREIDTYVSSTRSSEPLLLFLRVPMRQRLVLLLLILKIRLEEKANLRLHVPRCME